MSVALSLPGVVICHGNPRTLQSPWHQLGHAQASPVPHFPSSGLLESLLAPSDQPVQQASLSTRDQASPPAQPLTQDTPAAPRPSLPKLAVLLTWRLSLPRPAQPPPLETSLVVCLPPPGACPRLSDPQSPPPSAAATLTDWGHQPRASRAVLGPRPQQAQPPAWYPHTCTVTVNTHPWKGGSSPEPLGTYKSLPEEKPPRAVQALGGSGLQHLWEGDPKRGAVPSVRGCWDQALRTRGQSHRALGSVAGAERLWDGTGEAPRGAVAQD